MVLSKDNKPKMLYFHWSLENHPKYLKRFYDRVVVNGLSEFFEVIITSENCDYAQVCEKYQPDLVMFENCSLKYYESPLKITNTKAFPEIPKIGFFNSDAFCPSRTVFISEMERWGVETFFSYSHATAEYTPEIANQLFIIPPYIDTDTYYDYGVTKIIPILLTGKMDALEYEWRKKVHPILLKTFQCLIMPHIDNNNPFRALYDEKFGRLLNASQFIPTCGGMCKVIVYKHLEIPACKSCLVTEKTPILELYGFKDMVNCVFADEHDICDKLEYLMDHPDALQEITNAGYELVRTKHTAKQRSQVREWYELKRNLSPGQRILQTGWFEPLRIIESNNPLQNWHLISGATDRILMKQGDEHLFTGRYDEAITKYLKCLDYVIYMPEPKLRLALCYLYKGDPFSSFIWLGQNTQQIRLWWDAFEPDPVEWSYLLISLLCMGKVNEAVEFAELFPNMHRTELDRARWAVAVIADMKDKLTISYPCISQNKQGYCISVHQLPEKSFKESMKDYARIFKCCGKTQFAEKLLLHGCYNIQWENLNYHPKEAESLISLKDIKEKINLLYHENMKNWLARILSEKGERPLFIWGTGNVGQIILRLLQELGESIAGFIDNNNAKHGTKVENINIYPPQYLTEMLYKQNIHPYIFIASMYVEAITHDLNKMGFSQPVDFIFEQDYRSIQSTFPILFNSQSEKAKIIKSIEKG